MGYYSFSLEHDVFNSVQNSQREGSLHRAKTAPWYHQGAFTHTDLSGFRPSLSRRCDSARRVLTQWPTNSNPSIHSKSDCHRGHRFAHSSCDMTWFSDYVAWPTGSTGRKGNADNSQGYYMTHWTPDGQAGPGRRGHRRGLHRGRRRQQYGCQAEELHCVRVEKGRGNRILAEAVVSGF